MTEKEKEKAYDEAIERAKQLYGNGIAEEIFHELKESQDEKIRKWIIDDIRYNMNNEPLNNSEYKKKAERAIAWLEKQGEQNLSSANERAWLYLVSDVPTWKDGIGQYHDDQRVQELAKRLCSKYAQKLYNSSILSNSSNTGKNEQKSADKNKPRIDVGDWVVFIKSKSVYRVEKKENYEYTLRHILGGSMCLHFSNEELIREWTIEDAKDGDVLTTLAGPFIYNGKRGGLSCLGSYCGINTLGRFQMGVERHWTGKKVYPATKKQRDALMKAMNDAGYEWDADKKELKKEKAK